MQFRLFKMRLRRQFKSQRKQVVGFGHQAEQQFDQHVFKKVGRIARVRRFVIGWIGLLILLMIGVALQTFHLASYYQTVQPVDGGIYREGILGTFTTANPLYATTQVDTSVSRLVFSGLLQYNEKNQLIGDLAQGFSVDTRGTTYTVTLKPNLTWQDGAPVTSKDVVYTYGAIQNPDAQSPLLSSWQGIIVTAVDDHTVTFKLPRPLASFANNLTNGILPEHILGKTAAVDLRTSDFNTVKPIGTGPFKLNALEVDNADPKTAQEQLAFVPFGGYVGGKPRLDQFIIAAYSNQDQLISSFRHGQLTALAGLSSEPAEIKDMPNAQAHNMLLTAGTYVFLKNSSPLLGSAKLRQALERSTDQAKVIDKLAYPTRPVRAPLLKDQPAYDVNFLQPPPDAKIAAQLFDADGWTLGKDGLRMKDGKPLKFNLVAADLPEYATVGRELQTQWKKVGVTVELRLLDPQDFQTALSFHDYDALLYGISLGTDPDVFVYWDSTQADIRSANRLNLSEYKSAVADEALESGRTRLDPTLRNIKYKAFLQAWEQDAPAIGLYQPRTLYITNGTVTGLTNNTINTGTDRYKNVQNWQIRQARVTN
ncbi:MAG: hypothetical protein JWN38_1072 [Candidatus Saccharibacteria bacterium]|nr:hypothetical protein [Candidatus Saccharibacteria bacterium]